MRVKPIAMLLGLKKKRDPPFFSGLALQRQISSPTPSRHLSGDPQPTQVFARGGRHASGEQVPSATFAFFLREKLYILAGFALKWSFYPELANAILEWPGRNPFYQDILFSNIHTSPDLSTNEQKSGRIEYDCVPAHGLDLVIQTSNRLLILHHHHILIAGAWPPS